MEGVGELSVLFKTASEIGFNRRIGQNVGRALRGGSRVPVHLREDTGTGHRWAACVSISLYAFQLSTKFLFQSPVGSEAQQMLSTEKKVSALFFKLKDKVAGSKQLLAFVAA